MHYLTFEYSVPVKHHFRNFTAYPTSEVLRLISHTFGLAVPEDFLLSTGSSENKARFCIELIKMVRKLEKRLMRREKENRRLF